MNLSFEKTEADVTKLYTDLRTLVFSLAGRIVKPSAISETARPGMLRCDEIEMLKDCHKNPSNLLPLDRANFGDSFSKLLPILNLSEEDLAAVRKKMRRLRHDALPAAIGQNAIICMRLQN